MHEFLVIIMSPDLLSQVVHPPRKMLSWCVIKLAFLIGVLVFLKLHPNKMMAINKKNPAFILHPSITLMFKKHQIHLLKNMVKRKAEEQDGDAGIDNFGTQFKFALQEAGKAGV